MPRPPAVLSTGLQVTAVLSDRGEHRRAVDRLVDAEAGPLEGPRFGIAEEHEDEANEALEA